MPVIVELPQVGESVVEGVIAKWLKQPGDRLERYEPLVEVVTDKVTLEIPSPYDGVLSRLLAEEGATVPMGAPIAEIELDSVPAKGQAAQGAGTVGHLVKDAPPIGPMGHGPGEAEVEAPAKGTEESQPQRYSPAVRRLAQEHGVELNRVQGTGLGSRVTRADVLDFVEKQVQAPVAAATPTSVTAAPQLASANEEAIPLSPIRRIIAEHMTKSASQIPHAWGMVEVDVTPLVRFRNAAREEFQKREEVDLTYLPFVIKAVVESLKECPLMNSSWGGDKIILKKRINIGIAVAASEGLIVPVIHDADLLSIAGLARACRDLANKARQGRLALDEVQGGTFTVNNTGALGSIVSQPIINYPQAGILTLESIQKRPVVVDDAIAIRSMMNICFSFDHRIADGAEAGGFLQGVKRRLEAMGPETPLY